jgi:hypothetical protein
MLDERRPRAATPLCDLSVIEALRLRRRQGRAAYLIALFTERRGTQLAASRSAEQGRAERANSSATRSLSS